jgi:hypothetical protein
MKFQLPYDHGDPETEFDNTQETKIIEMIKEVFGDKNIVKNWQMVKESLVNRDWSLRFSQFSGC